MCTCRTRQVQGYKCLCDCHHWARPMGCDVFLICCHATYHLAPALILIHLHQIWSSTSRPHLYSVVSKLASLDAVARINTRTHRGFKSARSHEEGMVMVKQQQRPETIFLEPVCQSFSKLATDVHLQSWQLCSSQILHWTQVQAGWESLTHLLSRILWGKSFITSPRSPAN